MIFKKTTNKIKKFLVAAILSISMTGVATAAVEWNTAVTSEYIWRGRSQGKGAAVSGGIDISGDSGFSAGTWVILRYKLKVHSLLVSLRLSLD